MLRRAHHRPQWVIPVEEESSGDIHNTAVWLSILTLLLFFGAVVTALVVGFGVLSVLMIIGGLIMAGSVGVIYRRAPKEDVPPPYEHLHRVQRGNATVFDYAVPRQENNAAVAGGFFLAMAISFATMIGTGAARDAGGRPGAVLVFVISVGSLIFIVVRSALNPQRRDFYRGLLIGSILGAVGCGPCAAGIAFWG